jgi:hypothetical protein
VRSALEWAEVRALAGDGVSEREIARRLGINRRMVARLARGEEPPRSRPAPAGLKLDRPALLGRADGVLQPRADDRGVLEGHMRAFECWAGCRASASTTTCARSSPAARATRSPGIPGSCTCAATTASTPAPVRRRARARRARSRPACAPSRAASGRRVAAPHGRARSAPRRPARRRRQQAPPRERALTRRRAPCRGVRGAAAVAAGPLRLVRAALDAGADRRLPASRPLLLRGAGGR